MIARNSTLSGELWWLRKRTVCIDLGISFKFLKKSLENIIVVKSYAGGGAMFAISLRSPVHGQQQRRKRDEGRIRAPNKLYVPGCVMPPPPYPQETYTEAKQWYGKIIKFARIEHLYVTGLIFLSCYYPEASGVCKEYADIEIRKTPTRHMA